MVNTEQSQADLHIKLLGKPMTKLRPRFSRHKGKVRTYDSQSEEVNTIKWQLKARMEGREPLDGPLAVDMIFIFARPKSWPKKKRPLFHSVKPDLDNLIKAAGDYGNKILWYDDSQIAQLSAVKIYGETAMTVIHVIPLTT